MGSLSSTKPVIHGGEHQPRGADPAHAEGWHKCGAAGEPALEGAWTGLAWFRLVVGPPGHPKHSLEIVLAVDGGADGDPIFTLPNRWFDFAEGENIPGSGHTTTGEYRAFYVNGATGQVIAGPLP